MERHLTEDKKYLISIACPQILSSIKKGVCEKSKIGIKLTK